MMQELNYIRCGDYYIPDIRLPKETRPIGRWGRMHRDYIKEHNPIRFNDLCLSGEVWTYLADLNEQAQSRLELIIEQMKASEGVTEGMKQHNQMTWVRAMNSIQLFLPVLECLSTCLLVSQVFRHISMFLGLAKRIKKMTL